MRANLDSITTIPPASLQRRLALLSSPKLSEVEAAVRFALGLRA